MEEYVMESVVLGHHVYKSVWHPVLGDQLTLAREKRKSRACVPRELLSVYYHFVRHGGITRTNVHVCYVHALINKCGGETLLELCAKQKIYA